jgi:hypothetical protein
MAHVVLVYQNASFELDGCIYTPRACGKERPDGTWEGWLEFVPDDGAADVLRSPRETTQPNLAALEYWATGLTPVYLSGALERTLTPLPAEPAPVTDVTPPKPVLNPFSVYAKGEGLLRRQLSALGPRHLRAIVVGYELADPSLDLEALTWPELIELITAAVRERRAA